MRHIFLWIISLSLILVGCTINRDKPIYSGSCEVLLFRSLHDNLGKPSTAGEITALVQTYYGIHPDEVTVTRYELEGLWSDHVQWEVNGIDYIAIIDNGFIVDDGKLRTINMSGKDVQITAEKLIECIGHEPKWYRALYGPRMESSGIDYEFELWFPSAGITSKSVKYAPNPEKIPALTPKFEVERIDIVSPGPLAEVFKRAYIAHLPLSDPYGEVQRELQPWPGDWQEIEFVQGW